MLRHRVHRRDVRRLGDVGAGRARAGVVRGHVDDHRHRRRGHVLDDRAHRVGQPARRVEPDDRELRVLGGGVVEGARDPLLRSPGRSSPEAGSSRRCRSARSPAPLRERRRDRERGAREGERSEQSRGGAGGPSWPHYPPLDQRRSPTLPRVALDVGGEGVHARVLALLDVDELAARVVEGRRREADRRARSPRRSPRRGRCSSDRGAGTRRRNSSRRRARVVGVDAEEGDPLAESRGQALKPGHLLAAGPAPRGPLVDHHRMAAQVGEPLLERVRAAGQQLVRPGRRAPRAAPARPPAPSRSRAPCRPPRRRTRCRTPTAASTTTANAAAANEAAPGVAIAAHPAHENWLSAAFGSARWFN